MILRGIVSAADNSVRKARVIIEEFGSCTTPELPVAASAGPVYVNNTVVVVFFSDDPSDGLIVARI